MSLAGESGQGSPFASSLSTHCSLWVFKCCWIKHVQSTWQVVYLPALTLHVFMKREKRTKKNNIDNPFWFNKTKSTEICTLHTEWIAQNTCFRNLLTQVLFHTLKKIQLFHIPYMSIYNIWSDESCSKWQNFCDISFSPSKSWWNGNHYSVS